MTCRTRHKLFRTSYGFDWDAGEKIEMADRKLPRGWRILIAPGRYGELHPRE